MKRPFILVPVKFHWIVKYSTIWNSEDFMNVIQQKASWNAVVFIQVREECFTMRSAALLVHYHRQYRFTLSCNKQFLAYSSKPKCRSVLTCIFLQTIPRIYKHHSYNSSIAHVWSCHILPNRPNGHIDHRACSDLSCAVYVISMFFERRGHRQSKWLWRVISMCMREEDISSPNDLWHVISMCVNEGDIGNPQPEPNAHLSN